MPQAFASLILQRRCLSHPSWEPLKNELVSSRRHNGDRRTDPAGEDVPGAGAAGCVGGIAGVVVADGDGSFRSPVFSIGFRETWEV